MVGCVSFWSYFTCKMHSRDRMIYFLRTHLAYREQNINRDREPENVNPTRKLCKFCILSYYWGCWLVSNVIQFISYMHRKVVIVVIGWMNRTQTIDLHIYKEIHHKDSIQILCFIIYYFKLVPFFFAYNLDKLIESMCLNAIYILQWRCLVFSRKCGFRYSLKMWISLNRV